MRFAAVALLLVLGACSGGSDGPDATATTATATDQPAAMPTTPGPTGAPLPAALSEFRCEPDGAGTFTASGLLANDAKQAVTFQVTVFVGQATGSPQKARTKQVPKVGAGGSAPFEVLEVPAPPEGGSCFVQVLTTK